MTNTNNISVSVIMPCLNEEQTIGICVKKARQALAKEDIKGEIIVVDNGSEDKSTRIASSLGARIVNQPIRGYGAAYLKGIEQARGRFLVMGDTDDTYDFSEIPRFLKESEKGYDMVIGSRFMGEIEKGAMPFLNRHVGNPILTTMLNIFFGSRISDCHSGFRAVRKSVLDNLALNSTGMEFASEMIVASLREKIRIKEIPIVYHCRGGQSKLHPLIDAWRHVRFLLIFSPNWLFIFPGLFLFAGGLTAMMLSGSGRLVLFNHKFDVHAMVFFAFSSIAGFQILNIGLFAKKYALDSGFIKKDNIIMIVQKHFNLEHGILLGTILLLLGFSGAAHMTIRWLGSGMGAMNEVTMSLLSLLLMLFGIQILFSSFFLSLLKIPRKHKNDESQSNA